MPPHEPRDAGIFGNLSDEDVQHTQVIVGRGGGGIVYKGVLAQRGKPPEEVAVKTLLPGATESEEQRFLREARKTFEASKTCSGACRMYGCVHRDGALCLVMRLYPRTLHMFLDARRSPDGSNYTRPLASGEVVSFTEQILVALSQLHAEGIVIQDLKPKNLLMDDKEQLVISDFGLAADISSTMVTAQTTTTTVGGTPAYKAPEQHDLDTFGNVSPKTDMWALGCVVVEMLTGFAPWRGLTPMQIAFQVALKNRAPPIPPEATDEPLAALLRGCFSHAQSTRPSALDALQALRGGPTVSRLIGHRQEPEDVVEKEEEAAEHDVLAAKKKQGKEAAAAAAATASKKTAEEEEAAATKTKAEEEAAAAKTTNETVEPVVSEVARKAEDFSPVALAKGLAIIKKGELVADTGVDGMVEPKPIDMRPHLTAADPELAAEEGVPPLQAAEEGVPPAKAADITKAEKTRTAKAAKAVVEAGAEEVDMEVAGPQEEEEPAAEDDVLPAKKKAEEEVVAAAAAAKKTAEEEEEEAAAAKMKAEEEAAAAKKKAEEEAAADKKKVEQAEAAAKERAEQAAAAAKKKAEEEAAAAKKRAERAAAAEDAIKGICTGQFVCECGRRCQCVWCGKELPTGVNQKQVGRDWRSGAGWFDTERDCTGGGFSIGRYKVLCRRADQFCTHDGRILGPAAARALSGRDKGRAINAAGFEE